MSEILLALIGGALIGVSASLLLWFNGRVAGVSGMLGGLLLPARGEVAQRALFLAGLVLAGAVALLVAPSAIEPSPAGLPVLAVAGLLVGIGTRIGGGCTSGHGVCGVSRLSGRSLAATLTFMLTGVLTVLAVRALGGAP